jgi:hypothetical protein
MLNRLGALSETLHLAGKPSHDLCRNFADLPKSLGFHHFCPLLRDSRENPPPANRGMGSPLRCTLTHPTSTPIINSTITSNNPAIVICR